MINLTCLSANQQITPFALFINTMVHGGHTWFVNLQAAEHCQLK